MFGTVKREHALSPLGLQGLRQDRSRGTCSSSGESEPPGKHLLCNGSRVCPQRTVRIYEVLGFEQAQIPIQVYEVQEAGGLIVAATAREGTDLER